MTSKSGCQSIYGTQQAADATPDVVTGTISLFDTDAHVLVDSGATHSFISQEFIERVGIEMRPTECSMVVSLPTGDSLIVNRVYRGSKVTITSHEFEADLIILDIHDFDIILGMDWLANIVLPSISTGKRSSLVSLGNQK